MAIANGTYELLLVMDTDMALDVFGNSTANCANVAIWSRNDTNAQKWDVSTTSGITTLRDAETGKSLDVSGNRKADGSNVLMYDYSGAENQRWKLVESGTQTVNGTAYPVVIIGAFGATNYVLDVTGQSTSLNTNIEIWTNNQGANQKFVLVPTEWLAEGGDATFYSALPTPSQGGGGVTRGTLGASTVALSDGTYYPAFKCAESLYQLAYRTRTRNAGADWMSEWTDWKSLANDSTAWFGFGSPGFSNCSTDQINGLAWATNGIDVDNSTTYDRTDIEIKVRSWRATWGADSVPAHSPMMTYGISTVRELTISQLDVMLSPDGLTVGWATDGTQSGNQVTLECDLWGTWTTIGGASGTTTIPHAELVRLPSDGESVNVRATIKTIDGLTVTDDFTATVSYEGSHGAGLTLSATVDGTIAMIAASDTDAKAWLVVTEGHGTRFIPLNGDSPWKCAPPIGVPWQVLGTVGDSSTWASKLQTFPAIQDTSIHVTSQDLTKDLVIIGGMDGAPSADPSYDRTVESFEVAGRERPVYIPKETTEQRMTVEGALFGDDVDAQRATYDWFVHSGHAHLRLPNGFWAQVCVTGGNIERVTDDAYRIELNARGEQW